MSVRPSTKVSTQHMQFTPALEKLFNRVLARVYRGSTRKKCSRQKLLSLQHSQLMKKYNNPSISITSRPIRQTHTLIRKKEFVPEGSNYTHNFIPSNFQMRNFGSHFTERKVSDCFGKPTRCKTESIKCISDVQLTKNRQISLDLMLESDIFQAKDNKINQPKIKNRSLIRPQNEPIQEISQVYSEVIKIDNTSSPSRIKQLEGKRKINNIIKTKNKLATQLGNKLREQPYFKPWDVDQNDDLLF